MSLNSQIADLILEKGRAQAQGELGSGQAWSGALSQIGQTVATLPRQIQQQQLASQQQQKNTLEIGSMQRQADTDAVVQRTRQAIDGMLSDPSVLNEDGTFNIKSITAKMAEVPGGTGPVNRFDTKTIYDTLDPINRSLSEARDSQLKYQQNKTNALAGLAAGALRLGKQDGNYFSHAGSALAAAQKSGLLTPDEVTKTLTQIVEHQDQIPQILGDFIAKSTLPPIKIGKDEQLRDRLDPDTILAQGPRGAPTTAELALEAAHGDPAKAMSLIHPPPQPPNAQSESFMLDGKPVKGAFVPDAKGGRYLYNGEDVTSRAKVIPPAAIQINNLAGNQTLPSWALDGSRPSKEDGNKLDPKIGMTPNGLYQAAQSWIQGGQYPLVARGSGGRADAIRTAISSKAGAIAAEAGMDMPTLRAFYKSNAASLGQQQKMYDAVQGFMATADRNAELLETTLKKLPDIGVPVFNKPLRTFEKDVAGDANLSQFATYLKSVQNEYARIISQPNLAGQLTDSARTEAEHLIDPKATVPQMVASIQALKNEGANRLLSVGEQIQRIQSRMTGQTAPPAPAAPAAPTAVAATVPANVSAALQGAGVGRHTLSDGSVWIIGSDGSIKKGS